MRQILRRTRNATVLALVLAATAVGVGLVPINLAFLKDTLHEAVLEETGLALRVEGPLRLRLGLRPTIDAGDASLGQEGVILLTASSVQIRPVLRSALGGAIDIRDFSLEGVTLPFCGTGECPFLDGDTTLKVNGEAPLEGPLKLTAQARTGPGNLSIEIEGGRLDGLLDGQAPFPIVLALSLPNARATAEGQLLAVRSAAPGFELAGSLEIRDLPVLLANLGAGSADWPASWSEFSARFHISGDTEGARFEEMRGQLGTTNFSLSGSASWSGPRPRFELQGGLDRLVLDEWLDGAADNGDRGRWNDSLEPWFEYLGAVDAALELRVDGTVAREARFENLAIEARLENGQLDIARFDLQAGEQQLSASASLDTSPACPVLEAELHLEALDSRWFERLYGMEFVGEFQAEQILGNWQSCGRTLEEHRDSAVLHYRAENVALVEQGRQWPVRITDSEGRLAWSQPGRLGLEGIVSGELLSGEAAFAPLKALPAGEEWRLDTRFTAAGAELELAGLITAGPAENEPSYNLALKLDASRLDRLGRLAGFTGMGELPVFLQADFLQDSNQARLEIAQGRLGSSDIAGSVAWLEAEEDPLIRARLRSDTISVGQLVDWLSTLQSVEPEASERAAPSQAGEKSFPPIVIEWQADALRETRLDVRDVHFSGTFHGYGIKGAELGMSVAGHPLAGRLDLDFARRPASLAFGFVLEEPDFGSLAATLDLAESLEATARSAEVRVETEGESWREWIENARAEASISGLVWRSAGENPSTLKLDMARVDFHPGANSSLLGQGAFDGLPLRLSVELPPLSTVLDKSQPLPFQFALGTDSDIVLLGGSLDRHDPERLGGDLAMEAEFLDTPGLPAFERLGSPRADLRLETRFGLEERRVRLDAFRLQVADSQVQGVVDLQGSYDRLKVKAELSSPYIETEDFVPYIERWRSLKGKSSPSTTTKEEIEEGSILVVINRELEPLKQVDFDIAVEVDELNSANDLLGRGSLSFASDHDSVELDLEADGPGGMASVNYLSRAVEDGLELDLDARFDRLEFDGLLSLFNPESTATGQLFLETRLSSRVGSDQRIVEKLQGSLDALAIPREVGAAWLDMWASNLLFALLSAGEAADKKMNCMVARFEVEDGIMKSKTTFLDTTDIIVRAKGEIDLVQRNLDLLIAPQAKRERFFSVQAPVEIKGPLDEFDVGVAAGGIVSTLVRWYYGLIYVPWKWLTGERYPEDGMATCFKALDLQAP